MRDRDGRRGRWRVALLVLGLVTVTAGYVAVVVLEHDRSPVAELLSQRQMWEVASDDDATLDDIVDAGRVTGVERSGDHTVVEYLVEPEDDEGPHQTAWRLYDEDGDRVADGLGAGSDEAYPSSAVMAVPDGFLMGAGMGTSYEHLAVDGTLRPVERLVADGTRPGDVVVRGADRLYGGDLVYRPGDGSGPGGLYQVPQPDGVGRRTDTVIDQDGGVWVTPEVDRAVLPVHHSADGEKPWTVLSLQPPRVPYPRGIGVAGDRVVVVLARPRGLHSLRVRDRAAPATAPWEQVYLGVDTEDHWYAEGTGATSDGRVLLTAGQPSAFVVDLATGEHTEVRPPWPDEDFSITSSGGHLFATHRDQGDAWVRAGDDWEKLPR